MIGKRKRLSLVEYGSPVDLTYEICQTLHIDRDSANKLLVNVGNRVATSLRLKYNPIILDQKGVRAIDFAGLIRLSPSLELEVAPKFLCLDNNNSEWREDFFFLSTLSKHGRILPTERLLSSSGSPRDFPTLIARAFTAMYDTHRRRPLRGYRRAHESDFYIDGDPDPIDLVFPSPEGFSQEFIRFDRENSWNANIVAAAKKLLPQVSNPSISHSLTRLIEDLSPQRHNALDNRAIPARHIAWQPLHELSIDILNGLGLNYLQGNAHAPGYLVSTWRIWEDLVTTAARIGFGASVVTPQKGFPLGTRKKSSIGMATTFSVFPDCVIEAGENRRKIILDAKYKGHPEKGKIRISEADIYEAIAFSKATECNRIVLAYPASSSVALQPLGSCMVFEKILIGAVCIIGIEIETRGISRRGILKSFSENFSTELTKIEF